jgi:hypothetical protein
MTIRLAFRAAQRSCALNATASKSQVTQWRPTAQDLPLSHQKNPQGAGEDALYMTTYSAFDPGMTRPLPFNTSSPTNDSQREPPKDTGRCEDVPHTAFNAFEHGPLMSGLATGVEGINVDNLPSFFPPAQRKAEVQTTLPQHTTLRWSRNRQLRPRSPGRTVSLRSCAPKMAPHSRSSLQARIRRATTPHRAELRCRQRALASCKVFCMGFRIPTRLRCVRAVSRRAGYYIRLSMASRMMRRAS